jgi:hypothetical protein
MNITRKDATIHNVGPDDDFPGSFEVVLSTSAKDRDGDELAAEDWKQPLPDHITFDTDHGMSVATTVGSGVPSIEDGKLLVRGTYSSLPRAQDTRTLVKEGHIRTTSVAFMSEKATKDGKTKTVRELLNGAFVAIPSNREAVVLAAKSIAEEVKAGSRNSTADMARIQAIHDHALALGAVAPDADADDTAAARGAAGGKAVTDAETKAEDDAFHEAKTLLADVDLTTLPEAVQKAIALLTEDDTDPVESTEESAPAAAEKAALAAETDDGLDLQNRLTVIKAAASIAG